MPIAKNVPISSISLNRLGQFEDGAVQISGHRRVSAVWKTIAKQIGVADVDDVRCKVPYDSYKGSFEPVLGDPLADPPLPSEFNVLYFRTEGPAGSKCFSQTTHCLGFTAKGRYGRGAYVAVFRQQIPATKIESEALS